MLKLFPYLQRPLCTKWSMSTLIQPIKRLKERSGELRNTTETTTQPRLLNWSCSFSWPPELWLETWYGLRRHNRETSRLSLSISVATSTFLFFCHLPFVLDWNLVSKGYIVWFSLLACSWRPVRIAVQRQLRSTERTDFCTTGHKLPDTVFRCGFV